MTSLLGGTRRRNARGGDLGARLEALRAAAEVARGRLDDAVVDDVLATAAQSIRYRHLRRHLLHRLNTAALIT